MGFNRRPQAGFELSARQAFGCLILAVLAIAALLALGVVALGLLVNLFRAVTGL